MATEIDLVVLASRELQVPSLRVQLHESLRELREDDSVGLAVALGDVGEPEGELPPGAPAVPGRRWPERLDDLAAGGVAVLDPPDDAALSLVADDAHALVPSGHRPAARRVCIHAVASVPGPSRPMSDPTSCTRPVT